MRLPSMSTARQNSIVTTFSATWSLFGDVWRDFVRASDMRQLIVMSITKQMLSDAPNELQTRRGAVSKSRLRSSQVTLSASSDVAQKHLGTPL